MSRPGSAWGLLVAALAMPAIAALSQFGVFGPDNATIAARYPTLLMAAGYAFSIWSLIFLLDAIVAIRHLHAPRRDDPQVARWRPWAIAGFGLTSAWMVLFPMQAFGLALAVIWLAWATLARAAVIAHDAPRRRGGAAGALALHAGWLTLAAFLNTAQVVVAWRLAPTDAMLPWTLGLWLGAAALLLGLARRLRGRGAFVAAAVWGLVAVVIHQLLSPLPGSGASALVAALLAALLLAARPWLRRRPAHKGLVLELHADDFALDSGDVEMDKNDPPISHGVFKPVGHVVISFPSADQLNAARAALRGLIDESALTTYTDVEMTRQAERDVERAGGAASLGQELNLVKAHLDLARLGYHFLVVEADDDLARRVADAVRPHGAERAQLYGNFIIEELIEHPEDEPQVAESPDRGLDAQTPSGFEAERALRRR